MLSLFNYQAKMVEKKWSWSAHSYTQTWNKYIEKYNWSVQNRDNVYMPQWLCVYEWKRDSNRILSFFLQQRLKVSVNDVIQIHTNRICMTVKLDVDAHIFTQYIVFVHKKVERKIVLCYCMCVYVCACVYVCHPCTAFNRCKCMQCLYVRSEVLVKKRLKQK